MDRSASCRPNLKWEKDRGKNGSNIAGWMSLPFAGAEHVVLPCFAGAGDNGIKGNASGNEFFVISCALLSSGTRTLLISRWNVGGESVLKATRQYLDDVAADYAPSLAWHRAAAAVQETNLEWNRESRFKPANTPQELKGEHPIFWSGYMLFDVPTKHIYRNGREENEGQEAADGADAPDAGGEPEAKPDGELPGEGDGQPAASPPDMPAENPPAADAEKEGANPGDGGEQPKPAPAIPPGKKDGGK